MGSRDFDVGALFVTLDAQRRSRGMTWQAVAREINGEVAGARAIAASTLTGLRTRRAVEGDGVLQMLRWLRRTPESFVPGAASSTADGTALPQPGVDQILRFDTRKLYSALDAQRVDRGLTWKQVATEVGAGSAASLTRYAEGGRTSFPDVMRIAAWLGRPVAHFTRASSR